MTWIQTGFSLMGEGVIAAKDLLRLLISGLFGIFRRPYRGREIVHQFYFVANESLWIILLCVSFSAAVVVVEASFHMNLVLQNDSMVPGFAGMLILRELAAVVSCLLLASRVGAGWTAEISSMKVTEQIDALKMLGIEPVPFLLSPRLVAAALGAVVLATLSGVLCIVVATYVGSLRLGFSSQAFLSAMKSFISMKDLYFSMIKAFYFGLSIPLISCFFAFRCEAGAEGVGRATTNAVVGISLAIISIDFILTWIFSYFY